MEEKDFEYYGEYSDGVNDYSLYVNPIGLSSIINQIVEKASYKVEGDYKLIHSEDCKEAMKKIKDHIEKKAIYQKNSIDEFSSISEKLPNLSAIYRDITRVGVDDNRFGKYVFFHGKKVIAPKLAKIIQSVSYNGDKKSIDEFYNYVNDEELVLIDERIESVRNEFNTVESTDYKNNVIILSKLLELYKAKRDGHYFNTDLLRKYYEEAHKMIKRVKIEKDNKKIRGLHQ